MIEHRIGETSTSRVAQTTILSGGNMVGRFACGRSAVMAVVTALTQNVRAAVIHIGSGEIRGVMTHSTVLSGHRMRRTGGFTPGPKGCEAAVVARDAVTGNVRVIKIRGGRKIAGRYVMAIVAILLRGQMILGLDESRTQERILMTPFTTASDVRMHVTQELRSRCEPIVVIMAIAAVVLCRDVIGRFNQRPGSIRRCFQKHSRLMATDTITGNGGMHRTGKPSGLRKIAGGIMTDAAIFRCWNMIGRFTGGSITVMAI